MSIEIVSPTLFSIGSGGVIGFLVGFAIKRVIKILAVIAGIFFGVLMYLQKNISWLNFVSQNKQQEIQYLIGEIENLKKQIEEMRIGGDYQIPSQMSSQSVEWISNRTGIDPNRLQKMYQNGLRMLSKMRLQ